MEKVELTNAMRVLKDYCEKTRCLSCLIKIECDNNLNSRPCDWEMESEENK